jgi:GTP-binding protein
MFVDEVVISVKAGKGGDGCTHFRREKFVPNGGPDGGDGGVGGDLVLLSTDNVHTLYDFRHKKDYNAPCGSPGDQNNRHGKSGEDLIVKVPVGTQVRDKETQEILFDFTKAGQTITLAKGGRGGKGNAGFVSSIRQAPHFAEKGDIGESLKLDLELKLVADVALVGFPSVGKSTLISVISNAKPKVAEYHFTTLVPNLGVAQIDDKELVFVDVPGLIEGAHEGKGLGHQFLRHIERARYVLILIDITSDTPLQDFSTLRNELTAFSPTLSQKPYSVIFSKSDLSDADFIEFLTNEFESKFQQKPKAISAATHDGIKSLLQSLESEMPDLEIDEFEEIEIEDDGTMPVFRPAEIQNSNDRRVNIQQIGSIWVLKNDRLEQMVRQTDHTNPEAKERIYDVLKKWNCLKRLSDRGAIPGETIKIGEHVWEYRG